MSSELHESREALSAELLDVKRAVDSMKEELEAVDWYAQRAEASGDAELREVLRHHLREEIEHFAMLLEWLRRRSVDFDAQLRGRLFKEGDIAEGLPAEQPVAGTPEPPASGRSAGERRTIGSLIGSEP